MTREEKIKFITESVDQFEGVELTPGHFDDYTDEMLDKEVDFYDYLWEK